MSRAARASLALCSVFLLFSACTCGGKEKPKEKGPDYSALLKELPKAKLARATALVPPSPVSIVTSDAKGTWDALMAGDLGKALVSGGAVENVKLSTQFEELLTVAHGLTASSARPLVADALADAMAGPLAVGLTPMGREGNYRFVLAKEIDPSKEMTVRLAVMASAVKSSGAPITLDGQKIAVIRHAGAFLYVAAFQDVVIVSDTQELAKAAVSLALGKPGKSLEEDAEIREEAASLKGPQGFLRFGVEKDGPWGIVTGLDHVLARVELAPAPLLKVRGGVQAAQELEGHHAQAYVPKDALFFASLGAANPKAVLERLSGQAPDAFRLEDDLSQALGSEAFWALMGVDGEDFQHLFGVSVKDRSAAEKALPKFLDRIGGAEPRSVPIAPGVAAWCQDHKALCAALVKDYLVFALDQKHLEDAVGTALGKRPALSDAPGFASAVKTGEKRYLALYVDVPAASDGALAFFRAVGKRHNQSIDPDDVEESVAPLAQALKTLPPFGGALDAKGTSISGEMRALK